MNSKILKQANSISFRLGIYVSGIGIHMTFGCKYRCKGIGETIRYIYKTSANNYVWRFKVNKN